MVYSSSGAPTNPYWLVYGLIEGITSSLDLAYNAHVKYTVDVVVVYFLRFLSSFFVSLSSANPPDLVVSGQAQEP